ncbi:hypothetical protein PsorP6_010660 [Peronosclerospora sorghi]|uniref:Uncharacterized protein n=1 Tax=Peronosclerospora sorghi TaxID=230839 RepID=A0ACC0VTF8_9STRA|nr:hypothetical protein PsorP6_010660 [Peronosclerospora sorghi]
MAFYLMSLLQQKTRWVASKLSLRKFRCEKRAGMETMELRPVALAGASNCFSGSSTPCNHFARIPSEILQEQRTDNARWNVCRMCERKFSPLSMSRQYADFCSLDCKSAFMLGHDNAYITL